MPPSPGPTDPASGASRAWASSPSSLHPLRTSGRQERRQSSGVSEAREGGKGSEEGGRRKNERHRGANAWMSSFTFGVSSDGGTRHYLFVGEPHASEGKERVRWSLCCSVGRGPGYVSYALLRTAPHLIPPRVSHRGYDIPAGSHPAIRLSLHPIPFHPTAEQSSSTIHPPPSESARDSISLRLQPPLSPRPSPYPSSTAQTSPPNRATKRPVEKAKADQNQTRTHTDRPDCALLHPRQKDCGFADAMVSMNVRSREIEGERGEGKA